MKTENLGEQREKKALDRGIQMIRTKLYKLIKEEEKKVLLECLVNGRNSACRKGKRYWFVKPLRKEDWEYIERLEVTK